MMIEEYNYLWTSEKNDWVVVNTSWGYGIVNKANQTVLLVEDEELENALAEKMLSNGCKIYDDIKVAFNDAPGGKIFDDNVILCEKCGHEMQTFQEGHCCGTTCPNCGWGVATTYFEPYEIDVTDYHIILSFPHKPSTEEIKEISDVANCNYIEAKKIIESAPAEIFCGSAIEVMKIKDRLDISHIQYHIEPEFPY